MIWSKFHYFYANFKRERASNYCFQKECLKSITLRYVYFSFETIDISENKKHQYLNALKMTKNTVIGSVAKRCGDIRIWTFSVMALFTPKAILRKCYMKEQHLSYNETVIFRLYFKVIMVIIICHTTAKFGHLWSNIWPYWSNIFI